MKPKLVAGLPLVLTLALGGAERVGAISFQDRTDPAGLAAPLLADIPAGGIAIADFNRNGFPDLFVTGYALPNRLFFNLGEGQFVEDPAINASLAGELCSVTAAADFDNDGWPDLYVGCRGDNRLFRNLGPAGFIDVTPAALNHAPPTGPGQARTDAIAWGDLTGNGLLDLYVGIYPSSSQPALDDPDNLDRILLNLGDGQWINAAAALAPELLARTALAAVIADLDGDGRPDLYVVNDKLDGNVLWRNEGPGCGGWCFSDLAPDSGADRPVYGMGVAVGDIDRDGLWDLYFSSIGEQVLLRGLSSQPLWFVEDQDAAGVNHGGIGWATILADLDNDGLEDAYLAISHGLGEPAGRADQCYRNLGDGRFESLPDTGLGGDLPTMAAAWLDADRNGRLDLVLGHFDQGYRFYRNTTTVPGNWIGFRLEGGAGVNRDAIGTRITAQTADGLQQRELRAGESRGASHDRILHFGLGQHDQAEVVIYWPDGLIETVGALLAGRYHQRVHPAVEIVFTDAFEIVD